MFITDALRCGGNLFSLDLRACGLHQSVRRRGSWSLVVFRVWTSYHEVLGENEVSPGKPGRVSRTDCYSGVCSLLTLPLRAANTELLPLFIRTA